MPLAVAAIFDRISGTQDREFLARVSYMEVRPLLPLPRLLTCIPLPSAAPRPDRHGSIASTGSPSARGSAHCGLSTAMRYTPWKLLLTLHSQWSWHVNCQCTGACAFRAGAWQTSDVRQGPARPAVPYVSDAPA